MSCINSIKNYKYSILVGKIEKKLKTKKMAKNCVPKPTFIHTTVQTITICVP